MITIELDSGSPGGAEAVLGAPVLAAVAVHAACAVPGVRRTEPGLVGLLSSAVRQARHRVRGLAPAPVEGVRVRVAGDRVRLAVAVSVSGPAMRVGQAVQRAVATAVAEQAGVSGVDVEVSIVDIEVE
ncbi:MAG TPA: Asp23/Gls24 family envelope stress response protein [Actinophytocola sp.]|nr:Asp23/Gls24 family envelope stress response protein [Actinophytocola sp.]